ncbi:MAG: hypothetical protein KAU06_11550, partial [Candidatus Marinimicrobia bacterium]|nr:hypothetical protein [Candidatus Neomarinimicrobiota bacterium]
MPESDNYNFVICDRNFVVRTVPSCPFILFCHVSLSRCLPIRQLYIPGTEVTPKMEIPYSAIYCIL